MLKAVINDSSEQLSLAAHAEDKSSLWSDDYDEMVLGAMEDKSPCFIFYRLDDETADSGHLWLFISWSPDFAQVKQKMLYAATKSTLKTEFGTGQIKDELFGTVRDDVSLEGYHRHVKAQLAPAPLTNREEELEILRKNENTHAKVHIDTKQKTLKGVMFPCATDLTDKFDEFKQQSIDFVQFEIDIGAERMILSQNNGAKAECSVDQLMTEIPSDKGRFYLYRFKHVHEEKQFASALFIYSMPGFKCTVKERMLYSSCKSELIAYLKQQANIDIVKTFEISESSEIGEQIFLDELHPKSLTQTQKFSKPKGPTSRGPRRVTRPAATAQTGANE